MFLLFCLIFFKIFTFIFGEREKERERKIGRQSYTPLTGDLAHNPGMCPDRELNQQLFGSQAGVQFTELHQPGLYLIISKSQTLDIDICTNLDGVAYYTPRLCGIAVAPRLQTSTEC